MQQTVTGAPTVVTPSLMMERNKESTGKVTIYPQYLLMLTSASEARIMWAKTSNYRDRVQHRKDVCGVESLINDQEEALSKPSL